MRTGKVPGSRRSVWRTKQPSVRLLKGKLGGGRSCSSLWILYLCAGKAALGTAVCLTVRCFAALGIAVFLSMRCFAALGVAVCLSMRWFAALGIAVCLTMRCFAALGHIFRMCYCLEITCEFFIFFILRRVPP